MPENLYNGGMPTLQTVLDKGAVMDLQFLRAVKEGDKWQTKCLH